MCIFAQPVVSVSDTNIFARLQADGRQYLVYQMKFETQKNNAIVLPLPVQLPTDDKETLEFISLKHHERFFADLSRGFPLALPDSRRPTQSIASNSVPRPTLKVHNVGDFIASFVPSIPDFNRLDEQFRVPQESWDRIPRYSDFGFAVFQLRSRKGKPHPMAFRFRSRLNRPNDASVFFPTVHIHDGQVHDREEFDHTLYLQAPEFDRACGKYVQSGRSVTDPATGYVRSKWKAEQFCNTDACRGIVDPNGLVHRLKMRGRLKNDDVLARLDLSHAQTNASAAPFGSLAAVTGIASVAGFRWFCNRRDLVARDQAAEQPE